MDFKTCFHGTKLVFSCQRCLIEAKAFRECTGLEAGQLSDLMDQLLCRIQNIPRPQRIEARNDLLGAILALGQARDHFTKDVKLEKKEKLIKGIKHNREAIQDKMKKGTFFGD